MVFKIGQHAISKRDGTVIQIRRTMINKHGDLMLGIGRRGVCWVWAENYEKYRKSK